jgi:hypothetical protein
VTDQDATPCKVATPRLCDEAAGAGDGRTDVGGTFVAKLDVEDTHEESLRDHPLQR